MYLGFINEDFTTLIADPFLIFDGRMDTAEIADGGDTATITLTAESRLRDLERVRRYPSINTDTDPLRFRTITLPGDEGLEYVYGSSLQDKGRSSGAEHPNNQTKANHVKINVPDQRPGTWSCHRTSNSSMLHADAARKPFVWGENDCCLFAMDCVWGYYGSGSGAAIPGLLHITNAGSAPSKPSRRRGQYC